jgi:endonuclease G
MRNGMKAPHGGTMRNYTMFYDKTLKFAYWVSYPLFKECIGTHQRTDPWRYDDLIESKWQADLSSGFGDPYDRGHQLPSGDRTCDKVTNDDTFFFTNATPQVSSMNQGIWNTLEGKVRNWMSATDTLYVVTGAMPPTTNISYRKGMAIPEYYFKAIARKSGSTYQTIAFKMANQNIPGNYMEYAISVSELEKQTGFIFFPQLSSSIKEQLNTNLWN